MEFFYFHFFLNAAPFLPTHNPPQPKTPNDGGQDTSHEGCAPTKKNTLTKEGRPPASRSLHFEKLIFFLSFLKIVFPDGTVTQIVDRFLLLFCGEMEALRTSTRNEFFPPFFFCLIEKLVSFFFFSGCLVPSRSDSFSNEGGYLLSPSVGTGRFSPPFS